MLTTRSGYATGAARSDNPKVVWWASVPASKRSTSKEVLLLCSEVWKLDPPKITGRDQVSVSYHKNQSYIQNIQYK